MGEAGSAGGRPLVVLEDQTLRDGLQSWGGALSLAGKTGLLGLIAWAGLPRIQAGSFVNPRRLPQMTGTDELVALAQRRWGGRLSGLALNRRGLERAMACGLRHISLSVSVSRAHSLANVGLEADEALAQALPLVRQAAAAGLGVRAGVVA